jgi:hypothetical protein
MNESEKLAVRILARQQGQAIVVRQTRSIIDDPVDAIGIAGIRVVTEDQVQALAYGPIGGTPQLACRLEPMSRQTDDLEPFATWLCAHVAGQMARNEPLRLWVPHKKTVEMLGVLGRRYERNRSASPMLQEAARICRILAAETTYEGQQVVVVAQDVLLRHSVTGQMPIEDLHPDAILAWVTPVPGRDPVEVATERSRIPASGLLPNTPDQPDDDEIELLRKRLKAATGAARSAIENRIRSILENAVLREWQLLVDMRQAFLGLPLTAGDLSALAAESEKRTRFAYEGFLAQPSNPVPLAKHMTDHEAAISMAESAEVAGDAAIRSMLKRTGRVVEATVHRIVQPRRGFNPCTLFLHTDQPIVRLRIDDRVKPAGVRVVGLIRSVSLVPDTGITEIEVEIDSGVRSVPSLVGSARDWFEASDFPAFLRHKTLKNAADRAGWLVSGSPLPAAASRRTAHSDLLSFANAARRNMP